MADRGVAIIGAPLDLGAGPRGVDMGPSAIRYAGLEERLERARPRLRGPGQRGAAVAEATRGRRARPLLPEIRATCERIAGRVGDAVGTGRLPIVLGGDHSIALGTLGGLAAAAGGPGAVLWIDAHGDLNTPQTTPSGNVHGMPLAAALGRGGAAFESEAWPLPALEPARTTLIGVRALDDGERALLGELDVAVHTMSEVDRRGIEPLVADALQRAAGAAVRPRRRWTWTRWTPRSRRAWGRRCAAA